MTLPYKVIIADPPWQYNDKMAKMRSTGDGAASKYNVMSLQDLRRLARHQSHGDGPMELYLMDQKIADDAHLWMWVTNAFLEQAHWLTKIWGFTPKTAVTWVKGRLATKVDCTDHTNEIPRHELVLVSHIGQGHYLRNSTEHCIFATRGRLPAKVKNLPTAFVHPGRWPGRKHSEKPGVIHEWAEKMADGPYLELFARDHRLGWDAVGDQLS